MLNMILNPMGGILLANAGNVILCEIDVAHPAAKNMIEPSRTQDEYRRDPRSAPLLARAGHPPGRHHLRLQQSPRRGALHHPAHLCPHRHRQQRANSRPYHDIHRHQVVQVLVGYNVCARIAGSVYCRCKLRRWCRARAAAAAGEGMGRGRQGHVHRQTNADMKRYARVEKIPGGDIEESRVLSGVLLNKDITHPAMRRRIILLDLPLEYKKRESQTNMEFRDWARAQEIGGAGKAVV
ncbi:hypothetical protein CVT25_000102 [Psilocybe cyanescens]|uniref:Uncharacterized protein n=1 Tax=Psilocybe cyanescens TaxID=93625 RepID=A0A409XQC6_PSICY|nr:hypothetical protein CVT25_000102 [Psilocybe cyanescens]